MSKDVEFQKLKADLDLLGTSKGKVNCHALGIS